MSKIIVVDSIMGSGKTSAMIQKINSEKDKNYLFVTPLKTEQDRIVKECGFKIPQGGGSSRHHTKLDSLHNLLELNENIVITHALFLMANKRTEQLIVKGNYILILDEALDILHDYNQNHNENKNKIMQCGDAKFLISNNLIHVDEKYNVEWIGTNEKSKDNFYYSEIKRLADRHILRCINGKFYWEYAPDIFQWFSEIYVLTYLFKNTIMDCYFRANGLKYTKVSVENNGGQYNLCQYVDDTETKKKYAELIHLYKGDYNEIGEKRNNLSINWLKKCSSEKISEIKHVMRNYKDSVHASSNSVMWTTTKQYNIQEKLESNGGFKYIKNLTSEEKKLPEKELNKLRQFVPCNSRATNDFADRTTLMYMLNFNMPPEMKLYYKARGYYVDIDQIALSILIQWIWRSAIRNGHSINLFVPSARMRKLLCEWLGIKPY